MHTAGHGSRICSACLLILLFWATIQRRRRALHALGPRRLGLPLSLDWPFEDAIARVLHFDIEKVAESERWTTNVNAYLLTLDQVPIEIWKHPRLNPICTSYLDLHRTSKALPQIHLDFFRL